MSELKTLLQRFDSALERFQQGLVVSLPGPATDVDLQALEAGLGFPLPDEVRTLLNHHDGSGQHGVLPAGFPFRMCSARRMLEHHQIAITLFQARCQERTREKCLPDPQWVRAHPFVDWSHHPSRLVIGAYSSTRCASSPLSGGQPFQYVMHEVQRSDQPVRRRDHPRGQRAQVSIEVISQAASSLPWLAPCALIHP